MSIDTDIHNQNGNSKLSASQKRRQKRKNKKEVQVGDQIPEVKKEEKEGQGNKDPQEDVQIEYVAAPLDFEAFENQKSQNNDRQMRDEANEDEEDAYQGLGGLGASRGLGAQNGVGDFDYEEEEDNQQSALEELKKVFEKFYTPQQLFQERDSEASDSEDDDEDQKKKKQSQKQKAKGEDDDDFLNEDEDEDEDDNRITAQKKKEQRISIAELKAFCERPEVVEVWDTTADDPKLLTFLKAYRNSVPVPRHWSQKRKYLQGKRGIEKPPFELPDFIKATGIAELRNVYSDKEDDKKLKQKQREKMQPKMNRLDIAPEILIDAFAKHQTIPRLTHVGELYYEGKEYEAKPKDIKPGTLTQDLKRALGMIETAPPPWLVNMQRYGPPPSYPYLKVQGLNAPIPKGATFGYQPGGWGKPPVNENGEPLYGDVFGERQLEDEQIELNQEQLISSHWGEDMEEGPEEEEEESEEESEEEDDQALKGGFDSVIGGINSSVPTGFITPAEFNLRKQMGNQSVDTANPTPQLYQVLQQKKAGDQGNIMGGDHVYVMPDANKKPTQQDRKGGTESNTVQMAIDPEVLEDYQQDPQALQALYDQQLQNQASGIQTREQFIDMVAQHNAANKRKMQEQREKQQSKKQKQQQQQFKF